MLTDLTGSWWVGWTLVIGETHGGSLPLHRRVRQTWAAVLGKRARLTVPSFAAVCRRLPSSAGAFGCGQASMRW
jgi:hypothetical protein